MNSDLVLYSLIVSFSMTAYLLMALASCVYAFRRLTRPGMSHEVRAFFVRKHIAYVGIYILIWVLFLCSDYYHLYESS